MSEEEVKQTLIDRYVDLLEVKAANKEENLILDRKIAVIKVKLSSYNVDLESIEKLIFPN